MIIAWDNGHTATGSNYGAVGHIKESEHTRILGNKVMDILKSKGHIVVNCTVDKASSNAESLAKRVDNCNKQKVDLFVSLHFNCVKDPGANGVEVYTYRGSKIAEAKRVLENISAIGFKNRGIKDGSHLHVIRKTNAKAMLIEVCFISNKKDVDLYMNNISKIANTIVDGILNTTSNIVISKNENSPIAAYMKEQIKVIQKCMRFKEDGIVTSKLIDVLPTIHGHEKRGIVTVMQRILIAKGYLSKDSDTGIIGPANKNGIARLKKDGNIKETGELINKDTWLKLLEY